jgi:hypothetical protein
MWAAKYGLRPSDQGCQYTENIQQWAHRHPGKEAGASSFILETGPANAQNLLLVTESQEVC